MNNGSARVRSIDELNLAIDKSDEIAKGKTIPQLVRSAALLAKQGEEAYLKRDNENAYLLLGRYFNLIIKIQRRGDYEKYKDMVKETLGGNGDQTRRMDFLEKAQAKIEAMHEQPQNKKEEEAPREEEEVVVATKNPDTIDCESLHEMISKDSKKCLIIDCRPEADYRESRIEFQFTLNIPESLCVLGMSVTKLGEQLPNDSKVYWSMRYDRQTIVVIDWFNEIFSRNEPSWHLRNLMSELDMGVEEEKRPEMLLLEGGYERWLLKYPMKCTNPHVKPPKTLQDSIPIVGDIEYPNWEDIQLKESSFDSISGKPKVDRSTKSNAIKSHEKSTAELLEQKEKLLNKSLLNESQLMRLEEDYSEMSCNKENEEDASKETQLRYQIMELDTRQKDIALEQKDIDSVLQSKEENLEPRKTSKVQDLELRLAQQKAEREQKKKEQALKIARENRKPIDSDYKAPVKTPRKSSEIILSPRTLEQNVVPHFDRASKPVLQVTPQSFYDQQDFSPVYQKVERGLTGLKNLGNTCYMNSIIQCLSHTLSLTHFLLGKEFEKQINRSNRTKGHIVKTLAAVIKMLWSGECKYISSKFLKSVIGEQDNLFCGMDQQDSHEFLVMLIDWLQSDLQSITMPHYANNLPASEKAWLEYTKARESFILRLFYGQIKSTVKCLTCGEESATYDTFSNLSLELPMYNVDRYDITECFNMYFHGERISGWNCPRCKGPRDAIKKLDISKLPPVLVIHLKRFYADGYSFRKKQAYVDFPLNDLSMESYVSPKEKMNMSNANRYNLYAVSNHYGTMESGHYTAFCRNAKQNRWYKFDDHCVNNLDRSDVVSSAAYILFYTTLPDKNYITH